MKKKNFEKIKLNSWSYIKYHNWWNPRLPRKLWNYRRNQKQSHFFSDLRQWHWRLFDVFLIFSQVSPKKLIILIKNKKKLKNLQNIVNINIGIFRTSNKKPIIPKKFAFDCIGFGFMSCVSKIKNNWIFFVFKIKNYVNCCILFYIFSN